MRRTQRVVAAAACVVTAASVGVTSYAGTASAGIDACGAPHAHQGAYADFNGDGKADLAIGMPGAKAGSTSNAGGVEIRYGFGEDPFDGAAKDLRLVSPSRGDKFGATIATADVNGDYCTDLLVGAPGRSRYVSGAGVVAVFLGSPTGLPQTPYTYFGMGDIGLKPNQQGARFGASLIARPGADTSSAVVAVGVPRRDVVDIPDAGSITEFTLSVDTGGAVAYDNATVLTQDSPDISDSTSRGDHFGAALAFLPNGIAVGVPGESFHNAEHAGGVNLIYDDGTTPNRLLSQATSDVAGAPEKNDHFGAVLAADPTHLVVGIPNEDVGSTPDAGTIEAFAYDAATQRVRLVSGEEFSQNSAGIADHAEKGDHFGAAVAIRPDGAFIVGVPGEDVGTRADAGMVQLAGLEGTNPGWTEQGSTVAGVAEKGDHLGATVGESPTEVFTATLCDSVPCEVQTDAMVVGVPGEDEGSGAVLVNLTGELKRNGKPGQAGDGFGSSLAPAAPPAS